MTLCCALLRSSVQAGKNRAAACSGVLLTRVPSPQEVNCTSPTQDTNSPVTSAQPLPRETCSRTILKSKGCSKVLRSHGLIALCPAPHWPILCPGRAICLKYKSDQVTPCIKPRLPSALGRTVLPFAGLQGPRDLASLILHFLCPASRQHRFQPH